MGNGCTACSTMHHGHTAHSTTHHGHRAPGTTHHGHTAPGTMHHQCTAPSTMDVQPLAPCTRDIQPLAASTMHVQPLAPQTMHVQPLAPCTMDIQPVAPSTVDVDYHVQTTNHHPLPSRSSARAAKTRLPRTRLVVPEPSRGLSVLRPGHLNSAPQLWSEGQNPPAQRPWPGSSVGAGCRPPGRPSKEGFCCGCLFFPFPRRRGGVSSGQQQRPRSPREEIQVIKLCRNRASWGERVSAPLPCASLAGTRVPAPGMGCGEG